MPADEAATVSVMATGSDVFGSCVGEIVVSMGSRIQGSGFAVGGNIWDLFWQKKRLKIGGGGRQWCQVLEGVWGGLGVIEEIKSPCGGRGFCWSSLGRTVS